MPRAQPRAQPLNVSVLIVVQFVIWLKSPFSSSASVVVILRVAIPEGVVFIHSYYNFSLFENEPVGTTMGKVQASSGSDLYSVSYNLTNHNDLFSVDTNGTLQTRAPLDKEGQEWYILEVEAKDTRTPPTSAVAKVRPVPLKTGTSAAASGCRSFTIMRH